MSNRTRIIDGSVTFITGLLLAEQYEEDNNNNNSCSLKLTFDKKVNRNAFKNLILRPRGDETTRPDIQVEDLANEEVCCVVTLTTSNNYKDLGWILFSRFDQNPPHLSIEAILKIAEVLPSSEELEQMAALSSFSFDESKGDDGSHEVFVPELGIFLPAEELAANQGTAISFFGNRQSEAPLSGGVMADASSSAASEQGRQSGDDMEDEPAEDDSTASKRP